MASMAGPFANPFEVDEAIEKMLREPIHVTAETWGTGPTAEDGQRAMMALAGGPPPPRLRPRPAPQEPAPEV